MPISRGENSSTALVARFRPIEVKQAIERIEHLLVTNEFSDRIFDLRDGDTKTIRNLLAYRKVGVEGQTKNFGYHQRFSIKSSS